MQASSRQNQPTYTSGTNQSDENGLKHSNTCTGGDNTGNGRKDRASNLADDKDKGWGRSQRNEDKGNEDSHIADDFTCSGKSFDPTEMPVAKNGPMKKPSKLMVTAPTMMLGMLEESAGGTSLQ